MKWAAFGVAFLFAWLVLWSIMARDPGGGDAFYYAGLASLALGLGALAVGVARGVRAWTTEDPFRRGLLVLVVAAMLADLVSFYLMEHIAWPGLREQNPVMRWVYLNAGGVFGVALLKTALTGTILLLAARLERPWMLASAAGLAVLIGLVGTFGNVAAWLQ
jgi:hypothetical protein